MELIPNELLDKILAFCSDYFYLIRGVCRIWRESCKNFSFKCLIQSCLKENRLSLICFVLNKRNIRKILTSENLDLAAKFGSFSVVKWMRESGCRWTERTLNLAVEKGSIEMLIWMKSQGCIPTETFFMEVTRHSRFDVLDWIEAKKISLNVFCYYGAVSSLRSIEMLDRLWKNNCPFDRTTYSFACLEGNLEALKWLRRKNLPIQFEEVSRNACRKGFSTILKWCSEESSLNSSHCQLALEGGHVEAFLWLIEKGCQPNEVCLETAICLGQKKLVKCLIRNFSFPNLGNIRNRITNASIRKGFDFLLHWLHNLGFRFLPRDLSSTAQYGNFKLLIWLRQIGCEWDQTACKKAALGGQLPILQWLRKEGCPWNETTCIAAVRANRCDILEWAIEFGCPLSQETFYKAVELGRKEMLVFLKDRIGRVSVKASILAAHSGHLEVLQWLKENNFEISNKICSIACFGGHIQIIQWGFELNFPCEKSVARLAKENKVVNVLRWLKRRQELKT
ncbi:ankyrin-repeat protein [Pithovirus sibericum]|uniref:Ankyrin-repeat protein n=1 Tax=Pithovirus sibericum TaxID=1450746 RepID=W5S523_9VIRU|nr:ankyrin-repeat protein [Pithovirus sibericum]AHH01821.1 ankyrin-repeat protein [Pithovirus sibericum]